MKRGIESNRETWRKNLSTINESSVCQGSTCHSSLLVEWRHKSFSTFALFYSHETMLKSFQYNKFGGRFLRWEIIKRSLIIWIASAVPGSQPRCQTKKLTLLPQSKYHLEVMITAVLPFQNYHLWTMWWTFSAVSDDGSWMIFSSIPRHGSQVIAVRFVGLLRHQSD